MKNRSLREKTYIDSRKLLAQEGPPWLPSPRQEGGGKGKFTPSSCRRQPDSPPVAGSKLPGSRIPWVLYVPCKTQLHPLADSQEAISAARPPLHPATVSPQTCSPSLYIPSKAPPLWSSEAHAGFTSVSSKQQQLSGDSVSAPSVSSWLDHLATLSNALSLDLVGQA